MYYCLNGRYVSKDEPEASGRSSLLKGVRRSDREPVAVKVWPKDAPEGKVEANIWRSAFPEYFLESRNEGLKLILARRWIEGTSLSEYVSEHGLMEKEKAAAVCLTVALRLRRFYRDTGMYFGDLRPENIILGDNTVRLIDFESAGVEEEDNARQRNFKSKTLKFVTPGFAAPEVYEGKAGCASDFYALGVLLNYLVTGEASCSTNGLPGGDVKDFIAKCTEREPGARFGSIDAIAAKLGKILRDLGGRPLGTLEEEVLFYTGDPSLEEKPGEEAEDPGVDPSDGALLFPHYERGYRRLLLYVPGNVCFASELGYVFGACFGMKTCVYEFFDYAPPRIPYYFTESSSPDLKDPLSRKENGASFGGHPGYAEAASEDGPGYGFDVSAPGRFDHGEFKVGFTADHFSKGCIGDDFEINARRTLESKLVSFGAGTFDDGDLPDDDFMRGFMSRAYTDYDVTVICDSMYERRRDSLKILRYCDYALVTVCDESDEIEAAISRYTRLLRENHVSRERLKFICWEKNRGGAGSWLPDGTEELPGFLGGISYDLGRHYLKNAAGDVYCSQMKGEVIREYCDIASFLTFGEKISA